MHILLLIVNLTYHEFIAIRREARSENVVDDDGIDSTLQGDKMTSERRKGRITKTSVLSDSSSQPCEGRYMLKKFIFVF